MKSKKFWLALGAVSILGGGYWRLKFHPVGITVLTNQEKTHRVLAEARGLDEVVVLLHASDWPHTFWEPKLIYSKTEGREIGNYYWSKDGSVILHTGKPDEESPSRFDAAYDFKDHSLLNLTTAGSKDECHSEIEKLVAHRGGLGGLVMGLPDGKNY